MQFKAVSQRPCESAKESLDLPIVESHATVLLGLGRGWKTPNREEPEGSGLLQNLNGGGRDVKHVKQGRP